MRKKLNHIRFDYKGGNAFCVYIDGIDLVEIMEKLEEPIVKAAGESHLAGSYKENFFYSKISLKNLFSQLLGFEEPDWDHQMEKHSVLECSCGCEGCWPLICRIEHQTYTTTWADFETGHRRYIDFLEQGHPENWWDYSGVDGFVFSRAQYYQAVKDLYDQVMSCNYLVT